MIRLEITGNPFAANETVLGLFHAAINDMKQTGARTCTAVVTFRRMPDISARFRISLDLPTGASRPKRRPAMTLKTED